MYIYVVPVGGPITALQANVYKIYYGLFKNSI